MPSGEEGMRKGLDLFYGRKTERKKLNLSISAWVHWFQKERGELTSYYLFVYPLLRLTSGLDHPIENLLEFLWEELKTALSNWFHVQGFGTLSAQVSWDFVIKKSGSHPQPVCHALICCLSLMHTTSTQHVLHCGGIRPDRVIGKSPNNSVGRATALESMLCSPCTLDFRAIYVVLTEELIGTHGGSGGLWSLLQGHFLQWVAMTTPRALTAHSSGSVLPMISQRPEI